MAALKHVSSGQVYALGAHHLVGRGRACHLLIDKREVSGEHATLRWTGEAWELRDLNSSNGTYLNHRRLGAGETVALSVGGEIAFGNPADAFVFISDAPPVIVARTLDGTCVLPDEDGMLLLPGRDAPEYIIFADEPGQWFAELPDGDCIRLHDEQTLLTRDEQIWRLSLPLAWEQTWQRDRISMCLAEIGLRFRTSYYENHVDIEILHGSHSMPIETRAHSYLLLYLARARLQDCNDPELGEHDRGWVEVDELVDKGIVKDDMVNVVIHRARAQFIRAHVIDADNLIERRRGPRRLRIGVTHLDIIS